MTLRISWETSERRSDGATMRAVGVEHVLAFDAVITETHEIASTLTESPVERGAPIADHKRPLADRVVLEAVVTNTPIGDVPESGTGTGPIAFREAKSEAANAIVRTYAARFDRIVDVLDVLRTLTREPIFVTVTTRVRTYEHAQITRVSAPRKVEDGDSIAFTVEISQVRIVDSLRVEIPDPVEPRGQTRASRGPQASTEEPEESTLFRAGSSLRDAARGVIGS